MNYFKSIVLTIAAVTTFISNAASYSADKGVITEITANHLGHVTIQIDKGFSNATRDNQCPNSNGKGTVDKERTNMMKLIYFAKKTNRQLSIITRGCHANNTLNITEITIN